MRIPDCETTKHSFLVISLNHTSFKNSKKNINRNSVIMTKKENVCNNRLSFFGFLFQAFHENNQLS